MVVRAQARMMGRQGRSPKVEKTKENAWATARYTGGHNEVNSRRPLPALFHKLAWLLDSKEDGRAPQPGAAHMNGYQWGNSAR